MSTCTERLIALAPAELTEATRHPFLTKAATSALALDDLKDWLGQDRLYAYSYIHFISKFISKISLPTAKTLSDSIQGRWTQMLIDCLANIKREIHLFEEVAQGQGWLDEICAVEANGATQAYQDLFRDAVSSSEPLLVAMVTLWATEHCYYTAWSYAAAQIPKDLRDENRDVMQSTLIPNWSSTEFRVFVDDLAGLLNGYAASLDLDGTGWEDAQRAYRAVLVAETRFWPSSRY